MIPTTKMPEYPPGDPGPFAALNAPDLPLFCTRCDRRLVAREVLLRYDTTSGRPVMELQLVCPKVAQPFAWFFGPHDLWAWRPVPTVLKSKAFGGSVPKGGYDKHGFWHQSSWR